MSKMTAYRTRTVRRLPIGCTVEMCDGTVLLAARLRQLPPCSELANSMISWADTLHLPYNYSDY